MSALYLESFMDKHAERYTHREHLVDHLIVHHLHRHGDSRVCVVTTSSVHDGALKRDSYSPWSCEGSGAPGSAWTQALGAPCLLPTTGDLSQHTRQGCKPSKASDSWGRIVRTSEYTHTARDGTDSGYMPQSPAVKTNGLLLSPQAAAIGCRVEPLQAFSQTLAEC